MTGGYDADVAVVGGGPIGLAAALNARAAGLSVVLLEPRAGVIDKACGEGLMPSALAGLEQLGVDPVGMPLRGIAYTDGQDYAVADFASGPGRGVRRLELHRALLERAGIRGVHMLPLSMHTLTQDPHGVVIGTRGQRAAVRARYVIGADGLHSRTRRLVVTHRQVVRDDAQRSIQSSARTRGRTLTEAVRERRRRWPAMRRFGWRQHYAISPWTDRVEVHWGSHAEAYITPVAADTVGVAVLSAHPGTFEAHLNGFPELRSRLGLAATRSRVRAAGPLRQRAPTRVSGRVLLVGDAGGYVDALTGEGLSVGLAQAAAAVRAVQTGQPQRYASLARGVSWRSTLLTTALLEATRVSPIRTALVPAARRAPWLFQRAVDELASAGL